MTNTASIGHARTRHAVIEGTDSQVLCRGNLPVHLSRFSDTAEPTCKACLKEQAKTEGSPEMAKKSTPKNTPKPKPGCLCGCGASPQGKKSRFLPGHDARYYGMIKRGEIEAGAPAPTVTADPADSIPVAEPVAADEAICGKLFSNRKEGPYYTCARATRHSGRHGKGKAA